MADMSKWDADLPGDTPTWWISRKTHIPKKAEKQFWEFIAALKVYHGTFSDENLDHVKYAIEDVVTALTEDEKKLNWRGQEKNVSLGVFMRSHFKKDNKTSEKCAGPPPSNLEIGFRNLMANMGGPPTMTREARAYGKALSDSY